MPIYRIKFQIKPLRYQLPQRIEEKEIFAFNDKVAVKKAKALGYEKDISLSECNTARCYLVSVDRIDRRSEVIPKKTTKIFF